MAMTEAAEQQGQQVLMEMGRGSVRMTLSMVRNELKKTDGRASAAVEHFRDALRQSIRGPQSGQVTLKTFAQTTNGPREVVNLSDELVAREVTKELRKSGCTFSVEKGEGATTFHVRGNDAAVLSNALDRASRRLDERAQRLATKQSISERIAAKTGGMKPGVPTPAKTLDRPEIPRPRGGR